ncbi:hypothetical protein EZV62_023213 [Acer yangbiense]|uniref:Uncharacterized protein n=1 Tax=Acer yangbiense TaxID=1000413 RepID=A0A5C7H1N5_9ROSI|nr:hypothetical protein EZV62_023213 [Acer yangbiense]
MQLLRVSWKLLEQEIKRSNLDSGMKRRGNGLITGSIMELLGSFFFRNLTHGKPGIRIITSTLQTMLLYGLVCSTQIFIWWRKYSGKVIKARAWFARLELQLLRQTLENYGW